MYIKCLITLCNFITESIQIHLAWAPIGVIKLNYSWNKYFVRPVAHVYVQVVGYSQVFGDVRIYENQG